MRLHRPTSALIADSTVDATTWISYHDETGEHLGVRDADAIAPLAGLRCLNADTPAHVLRNAALDLPAAGASPMSRCSPQVPTRAR